MLATACQMFMGKSEGEIAQIALETLEGHQRAIIAHLTVEVCAEIAELQCFFFQLVTTYLFKFMSVVCLYCNKSLLICSLSCLSRS